MSVQLLPPTTFTRNCPLFASNGNILSNYQRSLSEIYPVNVNANGQCCAQTLISLLDPSNNNYNYYYDAPDSVVVSSRRKSKC